MAIVGPGGGTVVIAPDYPPSHRLDFTAVVDRVWQRPDADAAIAKVDAATIEGVGFAPTQTIAGTILYHVRGNDPSLDAASNGSLYTHRVDDVTVTGAGGALAPFDGPGAYTYSAFVVANDSSNDFRDDFDSFGIYYDTGVSDRSLGVNLVLNDFSGLAFADQRIPADGSSPIFAVGDGAIAGHLGLSFLDQETGAYVSVEGALSDVTLTETPLPPAFLGLGLGVAVLALWRRRARGAVA